MLLPAQYRILSPSYGRTYLSIGNADRPRFEGSSVRDYAPLQYMDNGPYILRYAADRKVSFEVMRGQRKREGKNTNHHCYTRSTLSIVVRDEMCEMQLDRFICVRCASEGFIAD